MSQTRAYESSPEQSKIKEGACLDCAWEPAPGELWPTYGPLACRWMADNLIFPDGDFFGYPFKVRQDQRLFIYRLYEYCPQCKRWRFDNIIRGEATGGGKTTLVAGLACLEFAGPPQIAPKSPNIAIAAASFDQADILFSSAATMLGGRGNKIHEAPLCGLFDIFDTRVQFSDGRPGRLYRVAAQAGTNEGGIPHLFIADEVHEWGEVGGRKARVHTVVGKSTTKRKTHRGRGRILNISTAGFDVDHSLLGEMYKWGKRALHDPSTAPKLLFDWYEAPDGIDYQDPDDRRRAVVAASPAAGVIWDIEDRVRDWEKPSMPHHEWIRYFANRWVDVVQESWLRDYPGAWNACESEWKHNPANPFVLSVDMALKHDSVAVARIEQLPDDRLAVTVKVWKADLSGRIDHNEIWGYVLKTAKGPDFRGVVYDPRYFEVPARMLEEMGVLAIQFDQSPQRLAPACGLTYELILDRNIVHDGDPELAGAVKAAVALPQERGGFVLKKGRSRRHIDAAIAMCMGVWVMREVVADIDVAANIW